MGILSRNTLSLGKVYKIYKSHDSSCTKQRDGEAENNKLADIIQKKEGGKSDW